jgi:hypothetical protein
MLKFFDPTKIQKLLQFKNGLIGLPYQLMHQLGSQIEWRFARMF